MEEEGTSPFMRVCVRIWVYVHACPHCVDVGNKAWRLELEPRHSMCYNGAYVLTAARHKW